MRKLRLGLFGSLLLRGWFPTEGSSSAAELLYLTRTAQRTNARVIGEVGFNAGYSTYAFLKARPDIRVISFDLGEHRSVRIAKKLIDERFPGRHTLIYGDSRKTVPEFKASNPDLRFDLVFIDGGHNYEVAKADLLNMRELASERAAVIMDDLMPWRAFGRGPAKAWNDAVHEGVLRQVELLKDGMRVDEFKKPGMRCWALGQYVL